MRNNYFNRNLLIFICLVPVFELHSQDAVTSFVGHAVSPTRIELKWEHSGAEVDFFEISRRSAGKVESAVVANLLPSDRIYVDGGDPAYPVASGSFYAYSIAAVKGATRSPVLKTGGIKTPVHPQYILDVFPRTTFAPIIDDRNVCTISDNPLDGVPSGSSWALTNVSESDVFQAIISHKQKFLSLKEDASRSWDIRIGKGGQIYSIRGAFGEAIPPQWRPSASPSSKGHLGASFAPWIDEVFQCVASDKDNQDLNPVFTYGDTLSDSEVHQAGPYQTDPILAANPATFAPKKIFYSPLLQGLRLNPDNLKDNAYSTLSWSQECRIPTTLQSNLLTYQQTRDMGNGIVEVTYVFYNFGDLAYEFLNIPWGGVRRTSLNNLYLSNPDDGKLVLTPKNFFSSTATKGDGRSWRLFTELGGYVAVGQSATDRAAPALGIVIGNDPAELPASQKAASRWRFGVTPTKVGDSLTTEFPVGFTETNWRNMYVCTTSRNVKIAPGEAYYSRFYYVFGSIDHIEHVTLQRNLRGNATFGHLKFSSTNANFMLWYLDSKTNQLTTKYTRNALPRFKAYAQPFPHSKPVFVFTDPSGQSFVTTQPYQSIHLDLPERVNVTVNGVVKNVQPVRKIYDRKNYTYSILGFVPSATTLYDTSVFNLPVVPESEY
jgi:hypothetical protein